MTIKLGQVPDVDLQVTLTWDADYLASITYTKDWPVGLVVQLVFDDADVTTLSAVVTGKTIAWDVDVTVVNPLITAAPTWVRLWYIDGAQKILWGMGKPIVRGVN